jgi:hypothetical protein
MSVRIASIACLFAALSATSAGAVGSETNNGCAGNQDDPCVRSGSCEIQGAAWSQEVTVDRSDIFDIQGWPGLCDMVHVGLVQGNCEPGGSQTNVTVNLSEMSSAFIDAIVGPLTCNAEPPPPPTVIPVGVMTPTWRGGVAVLLVGWTFLRRSRLRGGG